MSCNCLKRVSSDFDKAVNLAKMQSKIDKTDYVVYEYNDRIYEDRKSCWEKDGKRGNIKAIVFYI